MTKKDFFKSSFVLLGAGLMGFASCTNEDENSVTPDEKGLIPVEIRSGISGGRTQLAGDGKTVVFQANDSLAVWDGQGDQKIRRFGTSESGAVVSFKGKVNENATALKILYPLQDDATCDGTTITATIPATQTATAGTFDPKANLSVATADYTKGQNVTCTLENVCGLLKFKIAIVEGYTEYDYVEISDAAASNKQNIAGTVTINPSDATVTGGDKTVITLKAGSGQTLKANGSTVYYVVLKPGTFADGIEMKFYKDGADKYGTAALIKTGGGTLSITPGVILNAGIVIPVLKKAPPKPLSGKFTVYVSDDKKDTTKVSFAPGNLQAKWNGTGYDWAFAENQWDYVGSKAGNTTIQSDGKQSTAGNVVDLFGWTADGKYNDGMKQFGINTSQSNSDYNPGDECCDWGSLIGDGWRVLTSAEWTYLILNRNGATSWDYSGKTCQYVTFTGSGANIDGLLLYPDNYPDGQKVSGSIRAIPDGCVFLPCAGYRSGSSVDLVGSYGAYWSASTYNGSGAYDMDFGSGGVTPEYGDYRYPGQAVRLVYPSE